MKESQTENKSELDVEKSESNDEVLIDQDQTLLGYLRARLSLGLVLLLGVGIGVLLYGVNLARIQSAAVEELESQGAVIEYESRVGVALFGSFLWKHLAEKAVSVEVVNHPITRIDAIGDLPTVRKIRLVSTDVYSLEPLQDLWYLEELVVDNSPIRDLAPLEFLIDLKVLRVSGTRVRDLTPIASLQLEELAFSKTGVRSLEPISLMETLLQLEFTGTPICSLKPLSSLLQLKSVKLDDTNVNDLRPLEKMKELERVSLSGLPVQVSAIARLDLSLPKWECRLFDSGRAMLK